MDLIIMRLSFILIIYLGFIVSAKRQGKKYTNNNEDSYEQLPFADGVLDLRGGVRREFGLDAALIEPDRSMICSPLSVLIPLGKLILGAEGTTKKELLSGVGLTSSKQLNPAFTHLFSNMMYLQGVTLDVVSRIYVSSEASVNREFGKNVKRIFNATCRKIDPLNPRKTVNSINDWVAKYTRNKITNFLQESDIRSDTSMILVNAIYFSGTWLNKFEKSFTDTFYTPIGSRSISMMSRSGTYNYWKSNELNAQFVEIPYVGSNVAMIIVLPTKKRGLPGLLRTLKASPDMLNNALEKMKQADIILTMPKFKIESDLSLNSLYKKLGITSMFQSSADLPGIIDGEKVFVSRAKHKAVIEVNEKGTEASAATAVIMAMLAPAPQKKIEFIANLPFYFIIRMYQDQLFAGIFNGNVVNY